MNKQERKEQTTLPPCPNPTCRESHVGRNGSHRGRQRYHCRNCKTYFGETQGTPMYGLKTSAAEVAQALRDRLNALTRKTHAFAKRDDTWDALVGLQLFDHNFHRAHRALWLPLVEGVRRYQQRSPAMALGLTDHRWSFQELLTTRMPITP